MVVQRTFGIDIADLNCICNGGIFYEKLSIQSVDVDVIISKEDALNIVVSLNQKEIDVSDSTSYQYLNGRAYLQKYSQCDLLVINSILESLIMKISEDILAMARTV